MKEKLVLSVLVDNESAVLHCRMEGALDTEAVLTVRSREEQNV